MSSRSNSSKNDFRSYTVTGAGVNRQGNHWSSRDYGNNSNAYHYSNRNGSYYYQNPDGSKYYNDGHGRERYIPADIRIPKSDSEDDARTYYSGSGSEDSGSDGSDRVDPNRELPSSEGEKGYRRYLYDRDVNSASPYEPDPRDYEDGCSEDLPADSDEGSHCGVEYDSDGYSGLVVDSDGGYDDDDDGDYGDVEDADSYYGSYDSE